MKIMIQWAQKNARGWQQIDASQWANLPKLSIPAQGQRGGVNDQLGWIRNVSVQGITAEGFDHVAIEPVTIGNDEGVKYTLWNDDPDDVGLEGYEPWVSEPQAIVWTILPLASDPNLGMAINTRQSAVRYCGPLRFARMETNHPKNVSIRPLAEFVPPSDEITRHGVWLESDKLQEHIAAAPQAQWGWMHWCDHLPESETEMVDGVRKLKEQRAQGRYRQAEHTITYYQRDTNRFIGVGFEIHTHEDALELTTGVAATESVTLDAALVRTHSFATAANQPNSADWPSGVFHAQLNCTAASGGVVYGSDTTNAPFKRGASTYSTELTSPITVVANGNGDQNDFSGTGLKLVTSNTNDQAAGSASDVFIFAAIALGDSHGDAITFQLNTTDSYADGPWTIDSPSAFAETVTFFN